MTSPLTREQQIDIAWAQHQATMLKRDAGLTTSLRGQLSEQQNWRCCYCGIRMEGTSSADNAPTFEHVLPRSQGGSNDLTNLVIACRQCNGARGSEILEIHLLIDEEGR